MTAHNPITGLLSAPLGSDWTVEELAEQVLGAIAAQRAPDGQEFVLDAAATTDRQSQRILRPLLPVSPPNPRQKPERRPTSTAVASPSNG